MNSEAYELIALTARYIFVLLMLWILWRAIRGALIDSRRAARLRRLSPMTGVIGEFVVTRGDGKARTGMKYPVIREGLIGSSRQADVRIRHGSVRRRHAYFQLTKNGLHLRGHAGTRLRSGRLVLRELTLNDGDRVSIGSIDLLLVLTMPGEFSRTVRTASDEGFDDDDPLFDPDDWADETAGARRAASPVRQAASGFSAQPRRNPGAEEYDSVFSESRGGSAAQSGFAPGDAPGTGFSAAAREEPDPLFDIDEPDDDWGMYAAPDIPPVNSRPAGRPENRKSSGGADDDF